MATVATAMAAECPSFLIVEEFDRGSERRLDAHVHDVDAVDLVEDEMRHVADEHERGGEPGDAFVPAEQMLVKRCGQEREKHRRQDRVIDAAVVRHAVEDEMRHVLDAEKDTERRQPQLGNRDFVDQQEQRDEGEESGEAREQGARGPRVLEINVRQHAAEYAGDRHGDDVFRRHDIGGERQCRHGAGHQRTDTDVSWEICHG